MKKLNKMTYLYITEPVYRAYHLHLSSKDLCIFLQPATEVELKKVGYVNRSHVIELQLRMPEWWHKWYYSLSLEEKYRFAKIVEQRLRNYQLI
jgi:hypothetical protein